ncbi:undecaprenyl-diphosphate phosphatase [Thermosipho melanesiensis]|uniref:Undecaprenyl-diphosphatase n=2 Tax=Thermosipho melanesiensis TaxID=46541 RepID=UPPP_THEM4|nr:undecaprenyl-diphosphate phosphatase [Thermosipho melanesiensis]A6LJI3.1 RecName: Full=Undecaprenyl-diphosphatase; AltName: Full=Bacitracin resistance protein; AltName: Full=Undecaprenyl pyrophosphate phosphatase [Thermosipho melanesiensis BI429]ABR30084.1 Bacitracin resistance protein BacA [Thermosipho melanesiensis BI429]
MEIILGIVQGLTEFLPISSSGHLSVFSKLFNLKPDLSVFALLHLATLAAIVIFVGKELTEIIKGLIKLEKNYINLTLKIIVSTIPAAIFGVLLESKIEASLSNLKIISFFFLVTSAALLISDKIKGNKDLSTLTYKDALVIGIMQALAIFPGISRSGFTLFGSLLIGLEREIALKYSFLVSIPVILGAGLLEIKNISLNSYSISSAIVAFFFGLLSLFILKKATISKNLKIFSAYCIFISIFSFVLGGIK